MAQERHDGENPRGDADGGMAGQGEHLTDLAEDINEQYRWHKVHADAARRHAQSAREHLERLSLMLLEAREGVAESADVEWGTWVEENLAFGLRQAQRYVKIGRALRKDATRVSRGSLRKGLASIDAPVDREKTRGFDALFSSESVEWYTPANIVAHVVRALGSIDLDPCADPGMSIPAATHYTETDDGLSKEWRGTVYMNPPYGRDVIGAWIEKLVAEYESGRTTAAVALVPARTETGWFALLDDYPRCFLRKRVKFVSGSGDAKGSATFPSAAFYLGEDVGAFAEAFGEIGKINMPLTPEPGDYEAPEDGADEGREPGVADAGTPDGTHATGEAPRRDAPADRWPPPPPRESGLAAPVSRGPGSKWRLAPRIIDLYPTDYRVYAEPFVGTGAMLLSKKPSEVEIVSDEHEEIANLFCVIRDRPEELARAVDRSGFAEADLLRAYREDPSGLDAVERARRWLVLAHQGYLRQTGKPSFSVSTAPTARDSVRLWDELPEHIEAAARRLKKVQVLSRDAVEMIGMERVAKPDVLLYVDPPYLPGTRSENLYVHEMPEPDHVKLLEALVKHPGPVFLSGYKSKLYDDRLDGWKARDVPGYTSYGGRDEVLWMNEKAAAGARAADARATRRAAEKAAARRTPTGAMGMMYSPPAEPSETEPPAVAAVFGALIEGWYSRGEE